MNLRDSELSCEPQDLQPPLRVSQQPLRLERQEEAELGEGVLRESESTFLARALLADVETAESAASVLGDAFRQDAIAGYRPKQADSDPARLKDGLLITRTEGAAFAPEERQALPASATTGRWWVVARAWKP